MNESVDFMINVFDQSQDGIKNAITHINAFKARANQLFNSIGKIGGGVFGFLKSTASKVVDITGRVIDRLKWAGLVGLGAGILIGRSIIGATSEYETFEAQLQTITGSAAKAKKALAWATGFAATTPFQLPEIINSFTRLSAYQIDPYKNLRGIGDFAAAMGRPVIDAVEAVADAVMGEWERMKEFGIKREFVEAYAVAKGMVNPFNKMGQVIDQMGAQNALFGLMKERGGGGMARMMDTIAGKWSNLKDKVWTFSVNFGNKLAPTIKGLMGGIGAVLDKIESSGAIDKVADWVGNLFKRDNVEKAANFFASIGAWTIKTFEWMKKAGGDAGHFVGRVFKWLGDVLGGPKGFLDILRKITTAMAMMKVTMISLGVLKTFVSIAEQLANIPGVGPELAAGALGTGIAMSGAMAVGGNTMILDMSKKVNELLARAGMKIPGFPEFPKWGSVAAPNTKPFVDAFMSGFDGQKTLLEKILDGVTGTAQNTSKTADALNKYDLNKNIIGGGPGLNSIMTRYLFGGAAMSGGGVTIQNLNINGGNGSPKDIERAVVNAMGKVMYGGATGLK